MDTTDFCFSMAMGTPVIWYPIPVAHINELDHSTCGKNIHLSAVPPAPGETGWWTANCDFIPLNGGFVSNPELDVYVLEYGEVTFTWNVTNTVCTNSDETIVHFNQTPNAYAGTDIIVCGYCANLQAFYSVPGSAGQWSGNGGNFTSPNLEQTNVCVASYGTYVFTWSENNGLCFDQDNVSVTFIQEPVPNTTSYHDTVCGNSYTLQVLNSQYPGQWQAFDDGIQIFPTFVNGTNCYQPTANIVIPNFLSLHNTITFVWTEVNQNSGVQCFGSVEVFVTFAREPSASVGPDNFEQVCGNQFTLAADTSGSGWAWGSWVSPNVIAEFDDINSPNATITLSSPGVYGDDGNVTVPIIWVMNNSGCTAVDTMYVTFYNSPVANAGINDSICGFEYMLHSYYSVQQTENYTPTGWWSFLSGPELASISNQNSNTSSVTVTAPGIYLFVWRESNTNMPSCYTTDTVEIKFIEIPVIDAGDDFNVCGQCTSLNCISAGYQGTWQPMPGISWGDPSDPNSEICSQTYGPREFIWQETNGMCFGRDEVIITFWRVPTAEILTDEADSTQCGLCFNRLQAGIPGTGISGSWRDVNDPSASFEDITNSGPISVCVTQYGVHNFYWIE
ncbi:MAG TPA: hypothetical protein PLA77_09645, partial [Bacteroidales bacterium]|nr:hypothetical protein [Bacteroidales bacterium]